MKNYKRLIESNASKSIDGVQPTPVTIGDSGEPFAKADEKDAIMCEAIRKACSQIGYDIKGVGESGTTVNTIFLQWANGVGKPAGTTRGAVRAFCANVGDSRCVMLRSYETKQALAASSFLPKSRSATDLTSPVPEEMTNALTPAVELLAKMPTSRSHGKLSSQSAHGRASNHGRTNLSSSGANANRFVAVHLMSEDHKLTLHRERLRILKAQEGRVPAGNETECWHTLPADASAIYLPHYAKTLPPASFVGLPPCGLSAADTMGTYYFSFP